MGFNYAKERGKFEAEWRKLRQEYEQAGMEPSSIDEIYLFDLAEFRSAEDSRYGHSLCPISMRLMKGQVNLSC